VWGLRALSEAGAYARAEAERGGPSTVGLVKEILLIIFSKIRIFTSVPPKY
jgi:hypothetical protein